MKTYIIPGVPGTVVADDDQPPGYVKSPWIGGVSLSGDMTSEESCPKCTSSGCAASGHTTTNAKTSETTARRIFNVFLFHLNFARARSTLKSRHHHTHALGIVKLNATHNTSFKQLINS